MGLKILWQIFGQVVSIKKYWFYFILFFLHFFKVLILKTNNLKLPHTPTKTKQNKTKQKKQMVHKTFSFPSEGFTMHCYH